MAATQTQAHRVQAIAENYPTTATDDSETYAVQMRNAASNAVAHLEQVYRQQLKTQEEAIAAERVAYADALKAKDETIAELRRRAEVAEAHAVTTRLPIPLWRRLFRRPQS